MLFLRYLFLYVKNVVVKQVAETKIVAPAPTNAQGVPGGPSGVPRTPRGTLGGFP